MVPCRVRLTTGTAGLPVRRDISDKITASAPRQLQNIVERHLETTNTLYCDGHVKAHRLDALAKTSTLVNPKESATKDVMTIFTIEDN